MGYPTGIRLNRQARHSILYVPPDEMINRAAL